MKNKNLLWLVGILILIVAGYFGATKAYKNAQNKDSVDPKILELLVKPYSPTMGPDNAPVTLVEFLDPECESCRAMAPIVKQVMAEFEGKVRLVIRYMPLHGNSMLAVSYLEAAREQGKFWEALDVLFRSQHEWGDHHQPKPELIPIFLGTLGLDMDQVKASVDSGRHQQKAVQDQQDGMKLGANRTPTFFINGKVLERLGQQELKDAIQMALKSN